MSLKDSLNDFGGGAGKGVGPFFSKIHSWRTQSFVLVASTLPYLLSFFFFFIPCTLRTALTPLLYFYFRFLVHS